METVIISNHNIGSYTGSRIAIDNFKNSLAVDVSFSEIVLGQDLISRMVWKIPRFGKWLVHLLIPYYLYLIKKRTSKKLDYNLLFIYPMSSTLKVAWLYSLLYRYVAISVWYHNSYSFNRSLRLYFLVEEFFIKRFSRVYFISEALGELYGRNFNIQYDIIGHVISAPKIISSEFSGRELLLGISGTINDSCIDAFKEFLDVFGNRLGVSVNYIGNNLSKSAVKILEQRQIRNVKHVQNRAFNEAMMDVHAHVVLLSSKGGLNHVEYQTIFPTRLIEIVKSGRMIFAICGKDSFLRKELENYTNAIFLDELIVEDIVELKELIRLNRQDCSSLCEKYSSDAIHATWLKYNS